jgi:hypothetical protein
LTDENEVLEADLLEPTAIPGSLLDLADQKDARSTGSEAGILDVTLVGFVEAR